jgi:putative DNA primase/helicase
MSKKLSASEIVRLRKAYAMLGSRNTHEGDAAAGAIWAILKRVGKTWSDLWGLLVEPSGNSQVCQTDLKRLAELHEMLGDAATREAARVAALQILERYRLGWNDLLKILGSTPQGTANASALIVPTPIDEPLPLDLLTAIWPEFVDLPKNEILALSLWSIHSCIFDQFDVTPRLALLSPVRRCGKTTAFAVLEALIARPLKTDDITPAMVYHLIDRDGVSLLLDEADNAALHLDRHARAVYNSGHREGGKVGRLIGGEPRTFSTFSPLALAAIGLLPLPLMDRSIVIRMQRSTKRLRRPTTLSARADLEIIRQHILDWAQGRQFDLDPGMPEGLTDRRADNWRVLISIGDASGPEWSKRVRITAVEMSRAYRDEDSAVLLLSDIRKIFDQKGVDRISSQALVAALLELEGGEMNWAEFQGINDQQLPRKLTAHMMARLLRPFGIRAQTIWPVPRHKNSRCFHGYHRFQFEHAWRSYCEENPTSPHSSNIKRLFAAKGSTQ